MRDAELERVREGYEAFNRRDYDAIVALLDPEIEYRLPMDPLRRYPVFRGRDGVREFYGQIDEAFEEFIADLDSVRRLGDVIAVTGRFTVRPRGSAEAEATTFRFAHFWRIRDGVVVDAAFHDADNPFSMLESRSDRQRDAG